MLIDIKSLRTNLQKVLFQNHVTQTLLNLHTIAIFIFQFAEAE